MGSAYNRVIETRKELTKQLLAEMEQGELPWMKGWKTTGTRPYNPVTKAVYKGNNRLRLMLASHFGQFQDNRWVTFNQAKDKGWKIKSGEKGTLCEKWIFEEKKVIEDPVTGEKETVYEVVLVYKCRQKKLNSLYYKKKEQRRCSTWRKIKNRILRNSSSRSSISTMPEVPHILNWNMNMA